MPTTESYPVSYIEAITGPIKHLHQGANRATQKMYFDYLRLIIETDTEWCIDDKLSQGTARLVDGRIHMTRCPFKDNDDIDAFIERAGRQRGIARRKMVDLLRSDFDPWQDRD